MVQKLDQEVGESEVFQTAGRSRQGNIAPCQVAARAHPHTKNVRDEGKFHLLQRDASEGDPRQPDQAGLPVAQDSKNADTTSRRRTQRVGKNQGRKTAKEEKEG